MKNLIKYSLLALLLPFYLSSCDDGDDPGAEGSDIYVFSSAEFANNVSFTQNGQPITAQAGDDADGDFLELAFDGLGCADDDQEIELREDGMIYLVCDDNLENATQRGSWSFNGDRTELTVNLPTNLSPTGSFTLTSQSLTFDDDDNDDDEEMTAVFSVPVPIELTEPISISNVQFVPMEIEFDVESRLDD